MAAESQSVWLQELTSPEVAQRLENGTKRVIIPTGGTEQNGPHIALGKHNAIVHATAEKIAATLGNTLVAPVIAYVPEGSVQPKQGHMMFAGTLSVRDDTLANLLEDAARSLKAHGFTRIYFLSDHGGSIAPQEQVAAMLSKEWRDEGVLVAALSHYYNQNGQEEWVKTLGKGIEDPNAHAGFADASEIEAARPDYLRKDKVQQFDKQDFSTTGVMGDPSQASANDGVQLLALKAAAAVKQVRVLEGAIGD